MAVTSQPQRPGVRRTRPLLSFRRTPGRVALAVFRMPLFLYRRGWGWMLGHAFLLLVHLGRKTGRPHAMVAQTLAYDPDTGEAVILGPEQRLAAQHPRPPCARSRDRTPVVWHRIHRGRLQRRPTDCREPSG